MAARRVGVDSGAGPAGFPPAAGPSQHPGAQGVRRARGRWSRLSTRRLPSARRAGQTRCEETLVPPTHWSIRGLGPAMVVPVGAVSRIFTSLSRCRASRAPLAPFTVPVVRVLGRAGAEELRSYPGWQARRQSLPSAVRLAPRARVLRHLAPRAASDHFALCLREAAREARVTSGIN